MSTVSGKFSLVATIAEALSGGIKSGGPVHSFDESTYQTVNLANGTGAGQIDLVYSAKDTAIAASGTLDIDFYGGLTDSAGTTINAAKVKLLVIYNSGTVSITVKAKAGAVFALFSGSTDTLTLKAGDTLCLYSPTGVTVTNTTADKITITNTSGSTASAHTLLFAGTSV